MQPHDNLMPNASPARKMFSSLPAPRGVEQTEDNKGGDMRQVKALGKAVKKNGKLKTPNDQAQ